MFPQFGATAETLSKASTLMFRIGTDAHLYDDPDDVSISPLLDSKFDSEKAEALKRLLALIAQGGDVSNFFPQVVKNVATQSLEVKKLVYLYLLHYAEKRPNEALLSINCFQKDLGDTNPLVRAWALRAMAGIRLHVVAPLVLVAVSKCARDPSVYVRKCAANALPKLYDLRIEENTSVLEEVLVVLLNDHSPGVVGTAAAAFAYICPNNLSLVGRSYRRLCEVLPDVEEWGQIALIGILLRYVVARHGLARESIMYSSCCAEGHHSDNDGSGDNYPSDKDGLDINFAFENAHNTGSNFYDSEIAKMVSRCYIEGPDDYLSRLSCKMEGSPLLDAANFTSCKGNDDVNTLLKCTSPLLWSHNSAVVLAASAVHWIMGAVQDVNKIVKPLLFLLRSSAASRYVALCNIQLFAKAMPSLFSPYFEDFLISSSDSYEIKALKLEILSFIATESSISTIFQEFQDYIRDPDRRFAADTVAAIGLCAQRHPKVVNICLDGLLSLIHEKSSIDDLGFIDGEANVLIQAVMSLKGIIKQDPHSHEKVIALLVRSLDSVKVSAARAIIIWMVGEYNWIGEIIPRMLFTVLQYLARCFSSEVLETKLQILNTAIKVLLYANGENLQTFEKVLSYVLDLAKCDFNYDVRDRARMIKQIQKYSFGSQSLEGLNGLLERKNLSRDMWKQIFCGKSEPSSPEPTNYRFYLPGSLSQIVFHAAPGYEPLPKPCALLLDDVVCHTGFDAEATNSDYYETDGSGSFSGSSDGESTSHHSSQRSIRSSSGSDSNADIGFEHARDNTAGPLIHFSDVGNHYNEQTADSQSGSDNLDGLMSKRALESWLDEQPGFSNMDVSTGNQVCQSSARISIGDITGRIRSKTYTLLDPANGSGLKVDYSFSSEVSSISPLLVCLEVSFRNFSSESMTKIAIVEDSNRGLGSGDQMLASTDSNFGSDKDMPIMVPMDEIEHLEPEQISQTTLHVCFRHHLLPLKLALLCNGKKYPVKMWPDIGYFVKPLPMDIDEFRNKESHLPGMFEYMRRCTFTDHIVEISNDKDDMSPTKDKFLVICQSLAIKMLSNANVYLVSVDLPVTTNLDDATGLCLRFSSEILSNLFPCLITLTTEGKCCDLLNVSVKVNCEETVFGLNLLNRIINFLVEAPPRS